ncbi:hypothetical protein UY3_13209 [Chelonia mydas]|uniref:Uncharacterized protein n=1 Tax=Chelonia mydas TaxID=8469 RepID=M7BC05_CHEMY|nr:hypothetical protein UY3_13209 [Chelonia mydas]
MWLCSSRIGNRTLTRTPLLILGRRYVPQSLPLYNEDNTPHLAGAVTPSDGPGTSISNTSPTTDSTRGVSRSDIVLRLRERDRETLSVGPYELEP